MGVQSEDLLGSRRTASIHLEDVAAIVRKWRASLAGGRVCGKLIPRGYKASTLSLTQLVERDRVLTKA